TASLQTISRRLSGNEIPELAGTSTVALDLTEGEVLIRQAITIAIDTPTPAASRSRSWREAPASDPRAGNLCRGR
ncbi:MAG: hypothetical protein M3P18_06855, partial [Actinomycetota bacterium]|nr:hypothetical protein [Actinomycetota bacterium]